MLQEVEIREITTSEQLQQLQALDLKIWEGQALPTHQTLGAARNGGILLGAYFQEELIGFSYSFVGYEEEQMYLYSHMLGVEQTKREHGVGELLKHKQKEIAKEKGYRLIKWNFDPLQSSNAMLSFTKLGAISQTYVNDYYGNLSDFFNAGLPSDRLTVDWWIQRGELTSVIEELVEEAKPIVDWQLTPAGLPALQAFDTTIDYLQDAYTVPIPQYFQKLKVESDTLAEDWRYKMRAILTTLFNQGYAIVHVIRGKEHVNEYLVVKKSILAL
ncbi:chorismate synthase [Lysinibacillus alkalisoli]|uniref:Chorismate synthase n=1 Tax=Lysinibacillus alkalisoli TaxID=1911548 RepID=A0A917G5N6_9BACI|nr:GNAT family N-acetyltransferase [Lysinibacillus alkalisoli]GGG22955.1 chorismate synthase [Lysinibacillus alkalisoli]